MQSTAIDATRTVNVHRTLPLYSNGRRPPCFNRTVVYAFAYGRCFCNGSWQNELADGVSPPTDERAQSTLW